MQTEPISIPGNFQGSESQIVHVYYPKVGKEIEWGQGVRKRRAKSPAAILQPKQTADEDAFERQVRQTVWRAISMQNVNVKKLFEDKLLEGTNIIDRAGLSPKQHIKLLAEPKKPMYDTHSKEPVLRHPKPCTPRVIQLSIPKKQLVLGTWTDFQKILPTSKIDKLVEILNANVAMTLPDAEKCFESMDRARRRQKRKEQRIRRRAERRRRRVEQKRVGNQALIFAVKISLRLCGRQLKHVNHYEKQLSQEIQRQLVDAGKITPFKRAARTVSGRGLLQAADQCAAFVYGVLTSLDNMSESTRSTYAESETEESSEDEVDVELEEEGESEGDADEMLQKLTDVMSDYEESLQSDLIEDIMCRCGCREEDYHYLSDAELRFMQLLDILRRFYREQGQDETLKVFSTENLPDVKVHRMIDDIKNIMDIRMENSPFNTLQRAFQRKLTEFVTLTDTDILDTEMFEIISAVSHELALRLITQAKDDTKSLDDFGFDGLDDLSSTIAAGLSAATFRVTAEDLDLSSSVSTLPTSTDIEIDPVDEDTDVAMQEVQTICLCAPKKIDVETLDVRHKLVIMPHAPNMVCCASLKAWATWVKDVAINAKNWCLWIHHTIEQMRDMASILRGEVLDEKGQMVALHRDDWDQFVITLDKDIVKWRHYSEHVQELTENIISHFQDKKVACCAECEKENLVLSKLGSEHLCAQLAEALETTRHWREWLQSMVVEAKALTNLIDADDTATIQGISNSQELLAMVGATIMTNQQNDTGQPRHIAAELPQDSVYSIVRITSSELRRLGVKDKCNCPK